MNTDPIGYSGGLNLYTYASANPVNRVDPAGLDDLDPMPPSWQDVENWLANDVQPWVDVNAAVQWHKEAAINALARAGEHWNAGKYDQFVLQLMVAQTADLAKLGINLSGWGQAQATGEAFADPCKSRGRKALEAGKLLLVTFQWVAPLGSISGPGGLLFGRARVSGFQGLLNRNSTLRMGWSWARGRGNVFSIHAGRTAQWATSGALGRWHIDVIGEALFRPIGSGSAIQTTGLPWRLLDNECSGF